MDTHMNIDVKELTYLIEGAKMEKKLKRSFLKTDPVKKRGLKMP